MKIQYKILEYEFCVCLHLHFMLCEPPLALAHLIIAMHMWPLASMKTALSLHDLHDLYIYSPLSPSCVNLMHHFRHHFIIISL